jgi:hypothetical protein
MRPSVQGIVPPVHELCRQVVSFTSPGHPQYLVRSEKSGKTAVHHPDKLHKA